MKYISTRGNDGPLGYEEVLLSGLARDGGLYLPTSYPRFSDEEIASIDIDVESESVRVESQKNTYISTIAMNDG